ncbi:MAG: phosphoenolpyruvate synthase [Nanoarchaeota archaeon]
MVAKEAKKPDFIKWFSELSNKDVPIAGGKGASLAEMYNAKVPVPAGFVVTAQAYAYFIKVTGLDGEVKSILDKLDVNDTAALNKASREIRKMIESETLPKEMEEEIVEAYEVLDVDKEKAKDENALEILKKSGEEPFVAVRSSATTEDLADASFAGQQDTFLNVRGKDDLLVYAKKCMSSLFTARAIYYRTKKGFDHSKAYLSVVVQKMVDSEKSGVMFSQNPTSDDRSIVIEAVWGLGEGIVSGQIKPDHYVVDKDLDNFEVIEEKVSNKKIAIIRNEEGKNQTVKLNEERAKKKVLDNYEIKRLAQYARQLEEHYKKPQDIEFAIDKEGIYIVQSRPITTQFKKSEDLEVAGNVLLSGLGASPGVAPGPVKVVHDLSELEKVQEGDVMVAAMTNPDMVVAMERAAAIITDEGGVTSHAAIVSREMGIPAVVGTGEATKKLKDGDMVTVDGNTGKIIEGKGEKKLIQIEPVVPTKTKIKVIADLPEGAERAAKSECKAIGLTRLEGIIATGGKHPSYFVKEKKMNEYIELISSNLKEMIKNYEEIWVRSSDIRSDEYKGLEGAPQEDEPNPMMGDHGIRFSLKHPDIFKAELTAVKEVADEFPDKHVGLMIPLLIRVEELKKAKEIAEQVGLTKNIKLGIMVETPAAVQIIEELCQEGIDFISFGTNDLTQFTLALDRNNEDVQELYDETHPAVLREIAHVIEVCRKYGVETSICGQAGSRPEMAKFLVEKGIDSISVNADAAREISKLVAELEGKGVGEGGQEPPQENTATEVLVNKAPMDAVDPDNVDLEDTILKELDNGNGDYFPGDPNGAGIKDIPPLNDSMPIGSEMFQQSNPEETAMAESAVEGELIRESEEEFMKEWKGIRKKQP